MNSLPLVRRRSLVPVRLDPGRGLALVGVVGLALLAGCGASGEDNGNTVTTRPNNAAPILGGAGTNSGGGTLGTLDCTGPSGCDGLASEEVTVPPGCGNGTLTNDEACDDGNKTSGDGCADTCLRTEPGFSCANPGQPCREIARCGDGLKAATEQCDDGNVAPGDGCSARCRVEIGKKCDGGSPSVCTDAICGDGNMEGAEACDDGNTTPFDGCSSTCQVEPDCAAGPCTSACGDGLLLNEACDDGNLIDGDGCSSTCTIEGGFVCLPPAPCDPSVGPCVLRAPAIFRDFAADTAGDWGENNACQDLAQGAVAPTLDANGRPTLGANSAAACLSTPANFGEWYTSNPSNNQTLVGEVVLFDNGDGGYVNRYYPDGRQWTFVRPNTERQAGATLAACNAECLNYAQNGQAPFVGQLRCDNDCRPDTDALARLTQQLNQLMNANPPDPVAIADQQALIDTAQLTATACLTTCQTELDARVAQCTDTCQPCGNNPAMFCIFGVNQTQDGNPLFFPVDSITGPTSDLFTAKVPEQYGYNGFPLESTVLPGRPAASYNHNFYFTSEVQYWFKYDAGLQARLTFLGDDDVWVFLNGRLAVDLGGIHVPSTGSVTIDAAAGTVVSRAQDGRTAGGVPATAEIVARSTPAAFGLEEGNVYKITVFQAERQRDGSSFQLTLAGFDAAPSDCKADCGDGILSFGEECDDVVNDGGYGECSPGCILGPFCGDGNVDKDDGETCDVGPGGDATCRGCREFKIY